MENGQKNKEGGVAAGWRIRVLKQTLKVASGLLLSISKIKMYQNYTCSNANTNKYANSQLILTHTQFLPLANAYKVCSGESLFARTFHGVTWSPRLTFHPKKKNNNYKFTQIIFKAFPLNCNESVFSQKKRLYSRVYHIYWTKSHDFFC